MHQFLSTRGWVAFPFQLQTWNAFCSGKSGLVHAPTGSGKTLSVIGGPMIETLDRLDSKPTPAQSVKTKRRDSKPNRRSSDPLNVIWITPMRALANDTAHAIESFARELSLPWSIELRTSDTTQTMRQRQRDRLPTILVTTPESVSMLMSYPGASERLQSTRCVVVDEWHELLSTKRGTQTELALARLRKLSTKLRVWGLSATLGNLDEAANVLLPSEVDPLIIHSAIEKTLSVETLIPDSIEHFPWAGHLGLKMIEPVAKVIASGGTTLVFVNTRSQAEIWFRQLLEARPEWIGKLAIHHGSLDRKLRLQVEAKLREGSLVGAVCTSSLDLGVDFPAVDQVIQISSPKGIGRLLQRAGRSGHRPGEISRIHCAPTHAFELIEFSAAREGIEMREIEPRHPLIKPLDVLVQHLVTVASGSGFVPDEMLDEVRSTHAYKNLTDDEWRWSLDFIHRGGETLRAYERFMKVQPDDVGVWRIANDRLARLHRLGIGTITSEGVVQLVMGSGKKLGTIEESFISKVSPGQVFVFAGRALEMIGMRQMTARVRRAKKRSTNVPQWGGGKFPLSTQLAHKVRQRLDQARVGKFEDDEMRAIEPLLKIQAARSRIPAIDELLIESTRTREGQHYFIYPMLGRLVHEGLGALLAYRIGQLHPLPATASITDYGIELMLPKSSDFTHEIFDKMTWLDLLSPINLFDDLLACLNSSELTRRRFRDISRVAGLLIPSTPGTPRSVRQLQASSELFYDVFVEFDPNNLLLEQARREVLEHQLEINRLREALESLATQRIVMQDCPSMTPMAFPIWAQRIGSQTIRMEAGHERVERMLDQLEREVARDFEGEFNAA